MLVELRVRDLGVIDELSVTFGPGMTALTGETGAGKTLLVEAIQLVLGGKGSPDLVRAGAAEASVEALFEVCEPGGTARELVLGRTLPVSGRSKAFVDGRLATLAVLAEEGAGLVDIHGQHQHQSLLSPEVQSAALDTFAAIDLSPLVRRRAELRELSARLAALGGDERQRARELDMLGHQVREIDAAAVADPGEEAALSAEEERLADLGAHRHAAALAIELLDDAEASTTAGLAGALGALAGRGAFDSARTRLQGVLAEVADVASALRQEVERWEDDPARLAEVQGRRRQLAELRHKYGATLEEVLAFRDEAARRMDELAGVHERAAALEAERAARAEELAACEGSVRAQRRAAAPRFADAAAGKLRGLAMPGARIEVSVADAGAGDPVRLLLGANPGEPARPLARVASGGELARCMLALRLVAMGGAPVMIFDEVDAGVGGRAALALADALRQVSTRRQVLVVTHLAQVAAFADRQVALEKEVRDGRTVTVATPLEGEGRVTEVSRMLSGHPDSATARAHAAELLARARGPVSPVSAIAASAVD